MLGIVMMVLGTYLLFEYLEALRDGFWTLPALGASLMMAVTDLTGHSWLILSVSLRAQVPIQ